MNERKWGKTGRFLREVIAAHKTDDCLLWPYSVASSGYGMMFHQGKIDTVQRVVCATFHGEPPTPRHQAAHSCGNRLCCNPAHIRWATRQENEADKLTHGTRIRGSRHVGSKLNEEQVAQIIAIGRSRSYQSIADQFGVGPSAVERILKGRTWPHVERSAA